MWDVRDNLIELHAAALGAEPAAAELDVLLALVEAQAARDAALQETAAAEASALCMQTLSHDVLPPAPRATLGYISKTHLDASLSCF
jgi:hypothetical protein